MKVRDHDSGRLDVERFASDGGHLAGEWPLSGMGRLVECCHAAEHPKASDLVQWQAAGERRRAAEPQTWLRLKLSAAVNLTCQRCLGPVETPLEVDRWFRFVVGEQQAAQLDAESEDDVLASTRALDLHQLAEDELLLALPLVPRHETCPEPLLPAADEAVFESETPSPFAALASLRRGTH